MKKDKLNIDHVFILYCLYNNLSEPIIIISENFTDDRYNSYISTLVRKNLVYYEDKEKLGITQDGKDYIETLYIINTTGHEIKSKTGLSKEIRKHGFEEWWALYPANSKWEDKSTGTRFVEARPLRTGKEQCRKKYDVLINTGKVTHQQLIDSLKYEIKSRKIDSLKTNKNQLCFMKNSLSYLNQEAFLAFSEEIVSDPGFIQDCDGCGDVDISHNDIYDSNTELGN